MKPLTITMIGTFAALLLGLGTPAAIAQSCAPEGELEFLCGPVSPEDLAPIPDTPWVIVSSMVDGGPLHLADTRDHSTTLLYPAGSHVRHDRMTYGGCPGPVSRQFRPHGLYLQPGDDAHHRLYVVGHGAREAIEVFDVDMRGTTPSLTWIGCAVAPAALGLNSVVALPEGGFAATSPRTLDIWEWNTDSGWRRVPGSEDIGPNGLEISRDGEWFYVGGYGAQSLIRLSRRQTPVQKASVAVGFHIDNVRWGQNGAILAAGHLGPTRASIGECIRDGRCAGVTSHVSEVDLESLTAREIVRYPSDDLLILGTVAIQVDDEIWMGGVAGGDRIARFPAPGR